MTIDTESSIDRRQTFTDGLRAVADFFDTHPDLPVPYFTTLNIHVEADKFADAVRALGGPRTKEAQGNYYTVRRNVGGFNIDVFTSRDEVCEQVQVGERQVEVEEIVTPAITKTVTKTEPVMEWRCGSVLGQVEVDEARNVLANARAGGPSR